MSAAVCPRCGADDLVRVGLHVYCENCHRLFLWLLDKRKPAA